VAKKYLFRSLKLLQILGNCHPRVTKKLGMEGA
jgi:hypothetical protein